MQIGKYQYYNLKDFDDEVERVKHLLELVPKGHDSVLDIGSRDGYVTNLLENNFKYIIALDLVKPEIESKNIICVEGDVRNLLFEDNSVDVVICSEVLEHIPEIDLQKACCEMARVAKFNIVIGVPYRQDLRVGRTTCDHCGLINPPWGHVNSFNEINIKQLFKELQCVKIRYIGNIRRKTNILSKLLMDYAGNPFGTYGQIEPCIYCGLKLVGPRSRTLMQKIATRISVYLEDIQSLVVFSQPKWIHVLFDKHVPTAQPIRKS